jgi:hypothetical protein
LSCGEQMRTDIPYGRSRHRAPKVSLCGLYHLLVARRNSLFIPRRAVETRPRTGAPRAG